MKKENEIKLYEIFGRDSLMFFNAVTGEILSKKDIKEIIEGTNKEFKEWLKVKNKNENKKNN